jgi:hypothetical protein
VTSPYELHDNVRHVLISYPWNQDGATTAVGGLVEFIKAHGSGQGNNRNLNFQFVFFQLAETTSPQIRALFG